MTVVATTELAPTAPVRARRQYDSPLRRQRADETRTRIITAGSELLRGSSVRDWHGLTIRAVAGIDLRGMRLEDVAEVTGRLFEHVSSFPPDTRQPLDPTLLDAKRRQHDALLAAVAASTETWSVADRNVAAAIFDLLWSVASYERLVVDWQIDRADATRGITWVIGLLRQAITAAPDGLP
jgi:hypothetical protein